MSRRTARRQQSNGTKWTIEFHSASLVGDVRVGLYLVSAYYPVKICESYRKKSPLASSETGDCFMSNRFPAVTWPPRDEAIERSVSRLLADGSWAHYTGVATEELLASLLAFFGSSFVGLCSSGTIGVEIALRSVQVDADDEVILAAYDFPGNFRAVEQIGATPVLVDLAANSHGLDPQCVEDAIGPRTRAVIATHLHGQIAPLESLIEICHRRGLALIEDACQVPGARWNSRRLGTIGDVGVISFGGSKLLTAGRGGAILTIDENIYQRSRIFCDRGNDAFPLSQLQAAVLPPQIDKLDARNSLRQKRVRLLIERLRATTDLMIPIDPDVESAFYKLPLILDGGEAQRSHFIAALNEQGIDIGEGFRGFGLRSARRCRKIGALSNSQAQSERTCLLHHPVLLADEPVIEELSRRIAAALIRSNSAE